MTLPRALTLHKTAAGYRLFSQPVDELKTLRAATHTWKAEAFSGETTAALPSGFSAGQLELVLEFEPEAGSAADFGVELSNAGGERYRIGYDAARRQFYSDRTMAGNAAFSEKFARAIHTAPRLSNEKIVRFHLFFDASSAELFADGGATTLTDIFFPGEVFNHLKCYAGKGRVKWRRGDVYALKRIWP